MKTNFPFSRAVALVFFLSTLNFQLPTFAQGSLTPPGAPAPTMKTLDQVEPRIPISSLPFTIAAAGSYYLTGNLNGGAGNGILIGASGVTLDLMGFELVGGTGDGISVSAGRANITILNGTVRNWSGDGVDAFTAGHSRLERLRAIGNSGSGLRLGGNGIVAQRDNAALCDLVQGADDGRHFTCSSDASLRRANPRRSPPVVERRPVKARLPALVSARSYKRS